MCVDCNLHPLAPSGTERIDGSADNSPIRQIQAHPGFHTGRADSESHKTVLSFLVQRSPELIDALADQREQPPRN